MAKLVSADPIISEFVASNDTTLADEDGDFGDWIEIYNPDATAVNLSGWYLTDDKLTPTKWSFPSQTLAAGGRVVVFADSKNRAVAGSELHTNFKLSASGEYLALIKPDGTTPTSEFDEYPEQITDYSYGVQQATKVVNESVNLSTNYRYLCPNFHISDWYLPSYNDQGWFSGSGGIGYERSGTSYDPYINTDVESIMYGRTGAALIRYEFQVNDASAISGMDLLAKYDDGFAVYLNGELVHSVNTPTSLVWWQSAPTSTEANLSNFETWSLDGEIDHLVNGTNVLAVYLSNQDWYSSDLLFQTKLQLTESIPTSSSSGYFYFTNPTPGTVNNSDPLLPSGDVTISEPSGVKSSAISVTLTSENPATIYYTLDGSTPTEASTLYTGPLSISDPAQLRAIAIEPDKTASIVAVADYSFLDASLLTYLADVPVIVMDNFGAGDYPDKGRSSDGEGIVQVARQSNVMSFYDVAVNSQPFSAAASLESRAGCRVRGSSSSTFPRKPLSVELWDDSITDDDNDSASPFGMDSEADWVLYAPFQGLDKTLVHNPVTFEFGKLIGALTPDSRVVVVFQNTDGGKVGLQDLEGVYVLMEKIERKRAGVEFDKLSDDGTDGGWMISVNRLDAIPEGMPSTTVQPNFHAAGPNGVVDIPDDTNGDQSPQFEDDISEFYHSFLNFCEPGGFDILAAQRSVVQSKVRAMDQVLWSSGYANETTGFNSVIDVESWVNYYIAQNFTANQDAIVLSTYLFTEGPTEKIKMGPLWDFDRAYTQKGSAAGQGPLWAANRDWYGRLFDSVDFQQAHQDAWQEARRTVISDSVLRGLVDTAVAGLRSDQIVASGVAYSTWLTEVNAMKDWMVDRAQYLDSGFESLPTYSPSAREFVGSVNMTIAPTAGGVVYYTTDGSDPRAWGGGISGAAQTYTGALTFTERTRVTFRTFDGGRWSGKIVQDYYQAAELPKLVVSKFDYHPQDASEIEEVQGFTNKDDFEYIEIMNVGSDVADLSTVAFSDGIQFDFSMAAFTELLPGERAVVVADMAAFTTRYGGGVPILGTYSGNLRNSSEQVVLQDALLNIDFQKFTYDDDAPWPVAADGSGHTLVLKEPTTMPDHNVATNWRMSGFIGGNPGVSDSVAPLAVSSTTDSDSDGVSALVEHFLGTSDSNGAQGHGAGTFSEIVDEVDSLRYPTFSVRYQIGADDVTGSAEWSSTLDINSWDGTSASILLLGDTPHGDGTATRAWRSTQPFSSTPQFFRLKVER